MSGIAGVVYPDVYHLHQFMNVMLDVLDNREHQARKSLNHDTFTTKNVRLGISNGTVAANRNRSVVGVMEGRIYNQAELKKNLAEQGFELLTDQPSEWIVQAYLCYGEQFPKEIDGDFTAAIYDVKKGHLLLYRDRVGVKPLYWYSDPKHFLFASELKALLATGLIPLRPARDGIAAYLSLGYTPQDLTAVENVNKLLPGHFLRLSQDKGMSIHPYWSFGSHFLHPNGLSPREVNEKFNSLMTEATKLRSYGSRPGCLLSGGLGSAGSAYYVRKSNPTATIRAYSVSFKGENDVDLLAATGFANALNLSQETFEITPKNFLRDLIPIVWSLDEPLADPISVSTWNLSRLASTTSNSVLSGMGSDELLAAHSRYTNVEMAPPFELFLQKASQALLHYFLIPMIQFFNPSQACKILKRARANISLSGYMKLGSIFTPEEVMKACPFLGSTFNIDQFVHRFHNLSAIESTVSSYMYLDFKTRLPDLYIAQLEKLTTAFGLKWTSPFLYSPMIEFLATLTEPSLLKEEEAGKVLKQIVEKVFPKELINRPKRTRKEFLTSWIKPSGLDQRFLQLRQGTLVESGILSELWIGQKTANLRKMEENFRKLWALLILEIWFRLFINFPVQETYPAIKLEELLGK